MCEAMEGGKRAGCWETKERRERRVWRWRFV